VAWLPIRLRSSTCCSHARFTRSLRPLPSPHNPEVKPKSDRDENANNHTSRNTTLRSRAQRTRLRPRSPSSERRSNTASFGESARTDAFEHAVRHVATARSLCVRDRHVDCENGRDRIGNIVVACVAAGCPLGGGDGVAEACLVESFVAGG
jgi:hypothetical protein